MVPIIEFACKYRLEDQEKGKEKEDEKEMNTYESCLESMIDEMK